MIAISAVVAPPLASAMEKNHEWLRKNDRRLIAVPDQRVVDGCRVTRRNLLPVITKEHRFADKAAGNLADRIVKAAQNPPKFDARAAIPVWMVNEFLGAFKLDALQTAVRPLLDSPRRGKLVVDGWKGPLGIDFRWSGARRNHDAVITAEWHLKPENSFYRTTPNTTRFTFENRGGDGSPKPVLVSAVTDISPGAIVAGYKLYDPTKMLSLGRDVLAKVFNLPDSTADDDAEGIDLWRLQKATLVAVGLKSPVYLQKDHVGNDVFSGTAVLSVVTTSSPRKSWIVKH